MFKIAKLHKVLYNLESKKLLNQTLEKIKMQNTQTQTIDGYTVTLTDFGKFGGKRLFITNPQGVQLYGHKTSGINYLETAKREIADDVRLSKVGRA